MTLYEFDRAVRGEGYPLVCGVDEAGRGPLAGPVFAAAVILPVGEEIPGLDDSKKLTEKKRELLYDKIQGSSALWAVASATEEEIDNLNILQASLLAMRRAVQGLVTQPDLLLVDGNQSPGLEIPTRTVIKGDGKSACVAAASILAKVSRDRWLCELGEAYPSYQFSRHKGYPTKLHYELLDTYGPSPVHRQSFLRKWRESKV